MVPEISIIMPAYNEGANLARAVESVLAAFQRLDITGELVIVDDGSRDETPSIAQQFSQRDPFIRIVTHKKNEGIGAAYIDGLKEARGESVVYIPGDGENDPYDILRYLSLMEHVDIVVPYVYNREVRSLGRRILSRLYKWIVVLTFGPLSRYLNGTVIYRRSILRDLVPQARGFFFQTEILIRAIRRQYLYAEVPVALGNRGVGRSKAVTWSSFLSVARSYLKLAARILWPGRKGMPIAVDSVTARRKGAFPTSDSWKS